MTTSISQFDQDLKKTLSQYDAATTRCSDVFFKKMQDYGTSWRVLRSSSITDQLFIKAQRIRTLEESGENKVGEGVDDEYVALVNYSLIGLIQLQLGATMDMNVDRKEIGEKYHEKMNGTRELMIRKNHDYGEAWRDMRISSLTDLILMKLMRMKQIEDNEGKTLISEGLDANYQDIINYALFALIRLEENGRG